MIYDTLIGVSFSAHVYPAEENEQFSDIHTPIEKTKRELYSSRNRYAEYAFSDKMTISPWYVYAKCEWQPICENILKSVVNIIFHS